MNLFSKNFNRSLGNALRQSKLRIFLLFILCVGVLATLMYSVYGLGLGLSFRLSVGDTSPKDFITLDEVEIPDPLLTERARQLASEDIPTVYKSDQNLERLVISEISSATLPSEVQDIILVAYQRPQGVSREIRDSLIQRSVALSADELKRDVRLLLERSLVTTSIPDEAQTNVLKAFAANGVEPIYQTISAGQSIVAQGEIITQDHLQTLENLGLYSAQADELGNILRHILSSVLIAILLTLPLIFMSASLSFSQLSFLVLLSLVCLSAQRFAMLFDPSFLFLPMVALLVSVLISPLSAILWSVWLALCMGLLNPAAPLGLLIATLVGGLTAALVARAFKARATLLVAGLASGVTAGLCYLALLFLSGGSNTLSALTSPVLMIAGGTVAGILALGILPLAESSFDFLTEFRLSELSNPSSPLLQRLLLEAPGTYQHSLIISNLVEQAVTNIGGDALLARAGALYHDVGKLKRPHFYIENQFSTENPHNSISPHLSYLIITSHARDGVDMLKDYKLPKAFYPFAAEHHGTTVLSYFYKRALEESDDLEEFNFRYPGPKPQTKETAVLMLADAVESASRSLKDPNPSSIRGLIDQIFEMRLQDAQLSESPLNLHDIEVIANTFERMMTAILHRRVRYPSNEEIERLERSGVSNGRTNRRNNPVATS